ncbi:hypothetical protein FOZ63_029378 [Perkinsus olseni]|uniref:P-type ATPase N-terminal domain-containing protein n=1 Tax=Perkinsus olseni TaxID=32597 RepID=A0A7J6PNU3_PEROL|nr:hypothetical protein FOZ62_030187 [Perkinsus olseni]KAF4751699.1 hypothetical protein FOZ63_029378 [Perkinsus olseni]
MPSWRAISKVMAIHPQLRHLVVGESSHLYSSNSVSTREYTWATFLPLSIIFQFRRLSNCYFLLSAVLANLPDVGSLNPFASVAPLIFVLIVSVGREFIEEYQAYLRDREINRTLALVVHRGGHLVRRQWSDIHPGDIVIVKEREHFPADLVLLLSSHAENAKTGSVAYMETSNLDGETNLKTREAPKLVGTVLATNPSAEGPRPGSVQLDIGGPYSEDGPASPKVVVEEVADKPPIGDFTSPMDADIVKLSALVGSFFIDCEAPSTDMMKFQGTIATVSDHTRSSDNTEAVSIDNILLRGCSLRNTPWAAGVVVYAGSETKAIMNSRAHSMGPRKQSTVDKAMNKYVLVLFILQALLCGLATVFTSTYAQAGEEDGDTDPPWYLEGLSYQSEVVTYISYFLLLNTLIPVSLWVSVDVIKFAQSYLIEWDLQLHDDKRNLHARCNAKNMHEELGMVTHVFSDKTGTLTCNKMEFKGAAVGGKTYSEELLEDNSTFLTTVRVRRRTHFTDVLPPSAELVGCFQNALAQHDPNLERFLLGLAINHSCQRVRAKRSAVEDIDTSRGDKSGCCCPCLYLGGQKLGSLRSATTIEKMQESKTGLDCEEGPILYQGTSPDESALVGAAADFGFQFTDRTALSIELDLPSGATKEFKVLHVVEFTSERRMMSTVVTDIGPDTPDKIVSVFTKGADSSVVARCVVNADAVLDRTLEHTEQMVKSFAEKGYRTLCVAYRELRFSEWEVIAEELHEAQVGDMAFREEAVAQICDERIETELTLLGCTAVEDKLQDEVPETVEALRNAGITVAMITGDKRETAINIARSCNLISNPDNMYRVLCSPPDGSGGGSCVSLATMRVSESSITDARSAREEGVQFVEERVVWGLVDEEEQTEKDPSLSVVPGALPVG